MSEDAPTCQIHKKYVGIRCGRPALRNDPEGLCILHSHDPAKDPAAFRDAILVILKSEDSQYHDFRGVFFTETFYPEIFYGSRKFPKPVNFSWATFTQKADFSKATFTEGAAFSRATFTQVAHFYPNLFMKEADFSGATFKEGADFSGATFTEGADFSRATFTERAAFFGATFTKVADFFRATFTDGAYFPGANFKKRVYFSGATFTQHAVFDQATFNEKTYFLNATFTKDADFSEATFTQHADFSEATFTEGARFFRASIAGRIVFREINPTKEGEPPPTPFHGDFRYLQFQDQGLLRFQDLSLARVKFAGTDLRRTEFHHVEWHSFLWGRQAIYDEVLLRQEEKNKPWFLIWFLQYAPYTNPPSPWPDRYGEVERLYRELQENYEKARDYKKMGDFHYGEMEMHRRASKWRWCPAYFYNLYWFLSGYGERPVRALLCLIAFIFAQPLLVWWSGMEYPELRRPANYNEILVFLLEKASLQRPDWLKPTIDSFARLWSTFSTLLIPGQAALFLLALRNRLGRRR